MYYSARFPEVNYPKMDRGISFGRSFALAKLWIWQKAGLVPTARRQSGRAEWLGHSGVYARAERGYAPAGGGAGRAAGAGGRSGCGPGAPSRAGGRPAQALVTPCTQPLRGDSPTAL